MVVGTPMWVCADGGGDDIVGAVGTSPVHCDWDWQRGWRHNGAVVRQWVYHCYDDDAVIISYGAGSPSACARRRGRGAGGDAGAGGHLFARPIGLRRNDTVVVAFVINEGTGGSCWHFLVSGELTGFSLCRWVFYPLVSFSTPSPLTFLLPTPSSTVPR